MKKIIIILLLGTFIATGQNRENPLYQANFNTLVSYFGKDQLNFRIPPKRILDSLQSTPYVWVDGYRIQVAALTDSEKALRVAERLRSGVNDSVYVEFEKGLYRIQFGDYVDRIVAETKVDSMRKWGWPESWIVSRKVKKFITGQDTIKNVQPVLRSEKQAPEALVQNRGEFAIQLGAFSSEASARQYIREKLPSYSNAFILKRGALFKVLIGPFSTEETARKALLRLQQAGFNDAWLTETETGRN